MNTPQSVRIDKWLWAVRLFKTRSLATTACRQGRVQIAGQPAKPSHEVKLQETIKVQAGDITRTIKVLAFLEQRVGAKIVPNFAEDLTPPEELAKKRDPILKPLFSRPKGAGRPTKRERRQMDSTLDNLSL